MKHNTRLYNVIFPIWMLVLFPPVWLIVIPGNLVIDCAGLWLGMKYLKLADRKPVLKRVWWKLWLAGFAADGVGTLWMLLGIVPGLEFEGGPLLPFWEDTVLHIMHDSFAHPAAFLWTLAGVGIAGACIYAFDRHILRKCPELDAGQADRLAKIMAVVTAPWLFFIPMY